MSNATTERPVKQPGPDHPITVEPNPARVIVRAGGRVIADTTRALALREASYAPVQYIPIEDVEPTALIPSDHESYCPYKGEASYYSLAVGDDGKDAVWEYRRPYPSVAAIAGHVAFYTDRVEVSEEEI